MPTWHPAMYLCSQTCIKKVVLVTRAREEVGTSINSVSNINSSSNNNHITAVLLLLLLRCHHYCYHCYLHYYCYCYKH